MPSFLHEGLLELFRARLRLAPELLERIFGFEVPEFNHIELADGTWADLAPAELRADVVVLLYRERRPVFGFIVEAQLRPDLRKLFTWPSYAFGLRARHECPVVVLVVTPDARTARWAARALDVGGGQTWAPLVLGPDSIPIATEADAQQTPEFAVLSAIAHGRRPGGLERAMALIPHLQDLDDEVRAVYYDLVTAALPKAARKEIAAMALSGKYEFQTEFAKTYIAQGKQEGIKDFQAQFLIRAIEHRGFEVDDRLRARIEGADVDARTAWMLQLMDGDSVEKIFGDDRH